MVSQACANADSYRVVPIPIKGNWQPIQYKLKMEAFMCDSCYRVFSSNFERHLHFIRQIASFISRHTFFIGYFFDYQIISEAHCYIAQQLAYNSIGGGDLNRSLK